MKKLPKKIKVTIAQEKTTTPWDAFYDALNYIIVGKKCSAKARNIVTRAKGELCGTESLDECCKKAFILIRDEPIVYVDEISQHFPPELWELLDSFYMKEW